jgi:hypothetical protein
MYKTEDIARIIVCDDNKEHFIRNVCIEERASEEE